MLTIEGLVLRYPASTALALFCAAVQLPLEERGSWGAYLDECGGMAGEEAAMVQRVAVETLRAEPAARAEARAAIASVYGDRELPSAAWCAHVVAEARGKDPPSAVLLTTPDGKRPRVAVTPAAILPLLRSAWWYSNAILCAACPPNPRGLTPLPGLIDAALDAGAAERWAISLAMMADSMEEDLNRATPSSEAEKHEAEKWRSVVLALRAAHASAVKHVATFAPPSETLHAS